jgi:predicted metal-dependent peptidase
MVAMERARAALLMDPVHGFYGALAMMLPLVERSDIPTAATDSKVIYFNPGFVLALSEPERIGLLAHEIEHPARGHHWRRGNRDPKLWNVAADLSMNPDLLSSGFTLPKGALNESRFRRMSAESIYAILAKEGRAKQQDNAQPGQGAPQAGGSPQAGQGPGKPQSGPQSGGTPQSGAGPQGAPQAGQSGPQSGPQAGQSGPQSGPQAGQSGTPQAGQGSQSGGPAGPTGQGGAAPGQGAPTGDGAAGIDPGGCGAILDAAPDAAGQEEAKEEWTARVKAAAAVARAGSGRVPGFVESILSDLGRPKNDWRALVRRFADDCDIKESTWSRPSRRSIGDGFILPGMTSVAPSHLILAIDSSGSMDDAAVRAGITEAQEALDAGAVERLTVIYCDTRVVSAESYYTGDILPRTRRGHGGTRFAPVFRWIEENAPDASGVIYVSDLDSSDHGPQPHYPVLWLNTDLAKRRPVPWGDVADLDPNA